MSGEEVFPPTVRRGELLPCELRTNFPKFYFLENDDFLTHISDYTWRHQIGEHPREGTRRHTQAHRLWFRANLQRKRTAKGNFFVFQNICLLTFSPFSFFLLQAFGGTLMYSPPSDGKVTDRWDVWACGIVLYALVNAKLPFSASELLQKDDLTLYIPPHLSDGNQLFITFLFAEFRHADFAELLAMMLNDCAEERISIENVLQTKWCINVTDDDCESQIHPSDSSISPKNDLPLAKVDRYEEIFRILIFFAALNCNVGEGSGTQAIEAEILQKTVSSFQYLPPLQAKPKRSIVLRRNRSQFNCYT